MTREEPVTLEAFAGRFPSMDRALVAETGAASAFVASTGAALTFVARTGATSVPVAGAVSTFAANKGAASAFVAETGTASASVATPAGAPIFIGGTDAGSTVIASAGTSLTLAGTTGMVPTFVGGMGMGTVSTLFAETVEAPSRPWMVGVSGTEPLLSAAIVGAAIVGLATVAAAMAGTAVTGTAIVGAASDCTLYPGAGFAARTCPNGEAFLSVFPSVGGLVTFAIGPPMPEDSFAFTEEGPGALAVAASMSRCNFEPKASGNAEDRFEPLIFNGIAADTVSMLPICVACIARPLDS